MLTCCEYEYWLCFNTIYGSECTGEQLSTNRDISRILSIASASEKRNDTLHQQLTPLLAEDENLKINYHKKCVSRYCSTKAYDKITPPPKSNDVQLNHRLI